MTFEEIHADFKAEWQRLDDRLAEAEKNDDLKGKLSLIAEKWGYLGLHLRRVEEAVQDPACPEAVRVLTRQFGKELARLFRRFKREEARALGPEGMAFLRQLARTGQKAQEAKVRRLLDY